VQAQVQLLQVSQPLVPELALVLLRRAFQPQTQAQQERLA
jgi:hypothetical protein